MVTKAEHNRKMYEPDSTDEAASPAQFELLVVTGALLFEFNSFDDWVNKASRIWRFHQVRAEDTILVDTKGRIVKKGKEFMRSRDDGSFPIKVYKALIDD